MSSFENVGFVGFGPMGQLMAKHMFPGAKIEFIDKVSVVPPEGVMAKQIHNPIEISDNKDATVLTIPAAAFWGMSKDVMTSGEVRKIWPADIAADFDPPLIVDPCSVKMFTQAIIEKRDPDHPQRLHCHPLFGPQSASEGVAGKTVIVTKKVGEKADALLEQWERIGLKIVEMTAEEHDEKVARLQVVPFMLGRLANKLGLQELVGSGLETTSFNEAMDLARLDQAHSEELFRTIIDFNPFAHRLLFRMDQELRWSRRDGMTGELILHQLGLLEKGDITS